MPTLTLLRSPASVMAPGVDGDVEQLGGADVDVVALAVDLVGALAEDLVELAPSRSAPTSGCATQVPSKPAPASRFLSARHRLDRALVGLGVLARRDQRRHAAHRVRAAPVAGLDQQLGVGAA